MRLLTVISVLVILTSCGDAVKVDYRTGEHKPEDVRKMAYEFNAAMIAKDTAKLSTLLHDKLSYGHSNGWIETKEEQKANLYNGTITYHSVEQPELKVIMNGDIATVRGNGIFDVDYKEHEHLLFDLNVMQTWVYEDGRWQMLNRQSAVNKKE
ncbi:MAG: nuclear transport factor 2 family protein [Chitinophagaceae bacterium]|nr:nuclear transport factor 2 family protein [Chitinophagaceae bacterium]MCB9044754.1 nuclear transport factor 2 family protein [Chitinophagales bacterium]